MGCSNGALVFVDKEGKWFKPYGGEASARTKFQDGKVMAFDIPSFVEGKTTKAYKSYIRHIKPTIAENILFLIEDVILSMVFRGSETIAELQNINPSVTADYASWSKIARYALINFSLFILNYISGKFNPNVVKEIDL